VRYRYDAGERSWRYCFGAVGDGDAGVAVGELVVAGAWDSTVSLRGQNTAATTIITTITAIAYKKRLSPKKFIITSRNRPRLNNSDIGSEFGARSMVHGIPPESGWIGGLRGRIARFLVTAQVAGGSRNPEVCDQAIWVGVQGLQDIPALLPGC
jgi:hypothetical protein